MSAPIVSGLGEKPRDPHRQPVPPRDSTTVVFDDHRFCVGRELDVGVMAAPHRHSQIEINFILNGDVTYWFDGQETRLQTGDLALFWGMVPHRTIACAPGTRFVCLYVPLGVFLSARVSDRFRSAVLFGSMLVGARPLISDLPNFSRWREDLLSEDRALNDLARDEILARLRRFDHDGWEDRAGRTRPHAGPGRRDKAGLDKVQAMALIIAERAPSDLDISEIAQAVGLHPNYAMTLFKKTVGLTLADYLTRHRLDTAQTLLLSSDQDIANIAFASGFGSLSRFYEAFGRRFGMSPGRYRRGQVDGSLSVPGDKRRAV
jgi:AraC family transcriptional regulator, melibiose operon regulatory protein